MLRLRPLLAELLTALGLIVAPFILGPLGASPDTVNRILVWGLFGIGFDLLFGFTGLLSFGQSAFFGTGGMVAAYLLTRMGFPSVVVALLIGMLAAAVVGYFIGLIALRRTGIYFAMITVAIAEVFYFVEFNPLAAWTGGENGLPGVPTPHFTLGPIDLNFSGGWALYQFFGVCYFIGMVIALRIVRSPVGAILRAIRDNPERAAAVGHNIHGYKLTAFIIAAAYAGFAGGLLGVLQSFMPPDAFTFATSGQLVMQTAIGGTGTLVGPLLGAAVWLFLQDYLQAATPLGAAWKLVLGLIFVLLIVFLRRGIVGGITDLWHRFRPARPETAVEVAPRAAAVTPHRPGPHPERIAIETRGLGKRYGGIVANESVDFVVHEGEIRGLIGPNGAGKSTFFKMLTGEVPPTSGQIFLFGQDITSLDVTDVCQLGVAKSYQINQLFSKLTVRRNLMISALSRSRGTFRPDLWRDVDHMAELNADIDETLRLLDLTARADVPVSQLAYGEKRRVEIGLALGTDPKVLLLDEPLAGMSPQERTDTVALLKHLAIGRTLVVVEHDMDALFGMADRVTVMSQGRILTEGTPAEVQQSAAVQEAYLGGVHA
ncbi:MAG TPA: branched-chain amino acid ABC transporter ATP-binding protein/permease [Devosiaceae bacterium]|jgi:branched-chain amino acid transport system permease protein|nr:branched-chain amino acid ABC transporter ATP-binding protein/permease [Devosiaceae bacterium]